MEFSKLYVHNNDLETIIKMAFVIRYIKKRILTHSCLLHAHYNFVSRYLGEGIAHLKENCLYAKPLSQLKFQTITFSRLSNCFFQCDLFWQCSWFHNQLHRNSHRIIFINFHCIAPKRMCFLWFRHLSSFHTTVHIIESGKLSPVIGVNMSVILPGHEVLSAGQLAKIHRLRLQSMSREVWSV